MHSGTRTTMENHWLWHRADRKFQIQKSKGKHVMKTHSWSSEPCSTSISFVYPMPILKSPLRLRKPGLLVHHKQQCSSPDKKIQVNYYRQLVAGLNWDFFTWINMYLIPWVRRPLGATYPRGWVKCPLN